MSSKFEIEKAKFTRFMTDFYKGSYSGQRLGQAFYNAFDLHKMMDQASLENLYNVDHKTALSIIARIFIIR